MEVHAVTVMLFCRETGRIVGLYLTGVQSLGRQHAILQGEGEGGCISYWVQSTSYYSARGG